MTLRITVLIVVKLNSRRITPVRELILMLILSIRAYRAILSEFPGGGVLGRRSGVVHRRPFSIFRSPFSILRSPFSRCSPQLQPFAYWFPLVSLIASLRHWTPPKLDPRRQKASGTVPSFSDKHQPSRCPVAPSSVVSGPTATVKDMFSTFFWRSQLPVWLIDTRGPSRALYVSEAKSLPAQ
ncbi:hypothetical protein EDB80DRAFT_407844 [Ilyonectria destructans]|nr:hypothetical protein EDB80DRAFT_407844 [Ilyonectria destructans]